MVYVYYAGVPFPAQLPLRLTHLRLDFRPMLQAAKVVDAEAQLQVKD
jgi:hypothetical protein